jgi:hypothetical protein
VEEWADNEDIEGKEKAFSLYKKLQFDESLESLEFQGS